MSGILEQMARVKPPVSATETALTAGTQSAIQTLSGGKDVCYSFICDQAFNLNFSNTASTVSEPSTAYVFSPGVLYSFAIAPEVKAFRAKATANGTLKWWRSTYA